jgi:hypothetical protein
MHLMNDHDGQRANRRSATPAGFAQAVYEANAPMLTRQEISHAA